MDRKVKLLLIATFLLLTTWILYIAFNWTSFQNLRHDNALWVLDILNPFFYAILLCFGAIVWVSIWWGIENKYFHIIEITILGLILLCTPYFIAGLARFPDTFGVINNVYDLPQILGVSSTLYPANYPLSYLLFSDIQKIVNIDLFFFSRIIFSPLIIVSQLVLWYLFVKRLFNPKIAFCSAILAMPVLIIEISITPNAVAIILMLSVLLLITLGSLMGNILATLLSLALIVAHPFEIILLAVFIGAMGIVDYFTRKESAVKNSTVKILYLLFIAGAWLGWSLFISPMGLSIIRYIGRMLNPETGLLANFLSRIFGDGINAWIQQLLQPASILLLLLTGVLVFLAIRKIHRNHRYSLSLASIIKRIGNSQSALLIASFVLGIISLVFYFFTAGGEQILSRSSNFAALSISAPIAAVFLSKLSKAKNNKRKAFNIFISLMVILSLIAITSYPIYGYSRESYVSFSESYGAGLVFDEVKGTDQTLVGKIIITENMKYQALLKGERYIDKFIIYQDTTQLSSTYDKIYSSGYYSIYLATG